MPADFADLRKCTAPEKVVSVSRETVTTEIKLQQSWNKTVWKVFCFSRETF